MAPAQQPSSSTALTKRAADTSLMPPPPPPKRIKRPPKVIDEDTYTSALSHIIARDFFPGLLETQHQQEYLDALDSRDSQWIADAGRKLTEVMTPGPDGRRLRGRRGTSMTPVMGRAGETPLTGRAEETPRGWLGDTPQSVAPTDSGAARGDKAEEVDVNMSLGAFQAKYTSEDNESFNALLDKQNVKRSEKYAWAYNGNKIPSARQIAYREREARLLTSGRPSTATADGTQLILRSSQLEDRKAMVDFKPSAARNTFMFAPESIEDTHMTVAQVAQEASNAPPRQVVYDNTRLRALPEDSEPQIPPSPSISAINAAIAGRPRPTESEPGYTGAETPRVNGYTFVDEEEPPPPPPNHPSNASLLSSMLSASDGGGNPFHIRSASKREDLHHRMVDKVAKKRSAAGGRGESSMTPRMPGTPGTRADSLTPAAQKLLSRVGTPVAHGMGGSFGRTGAQGSGGRDMWTPTPRVKRK